MCPRCDGALLCYTRVVFDTILAWDAYDKVLVARLVILAVLLVRKLRCGSSLCAVGTFVAMSDTRILSRIPWFDCRVVTRSHAM